MRADEVRGRIPAGSTDRHVSIVQGGVHFPADGCPVFLVVLYFCPVFLFAGRPTVRYKLVFLNGCKSAQMASDDTRKPAVDAMFNAFNTDVYMGWSENISSVISDNFAQVFFRECAAGRTVSAATIEAIRRLPDEVREEGTRLQRTFFHARITMQDGYKIDVR